MFGFNTILFINFTYSLLRVKLFSRLIQLPQRKLFVIMHFTFHKIYYLFPPEESGVCSFVSDALLKHIQDYLGNQMTNTKKQRNTRSSVNCSVGLLIDFILPKNTFTMISGKASLQIVSRRIKPYF